MRIKLNQRKLKNGLQSLYLEFYKGYVITKDEDTYLGSVMACSPTAYMMAVFAFDFMTGIVNAGSRVPPDWFGQYLFFL